MASSISALSYLDPSAYQSVLPSSVSSILTASGASGSISGPDAVQQLQAIARQGDLRAYLNNSVAAALLQPATSGGSTDANALINSMLQQVLGTYQSQSNSP